MSSHTLGRRGQLPKLSKCVLEGQQRLSFGSGGLAVVPPPRAQAESTSGTAAAAAAGADEPTATGAEAAPEAAAAAAGAHVPKRQRVSRSEKGVAKDVLSSWQQQFGWLELKETDAGSVITCTECVEARLAGVRGCSGPFAEKGSRDLQKGALRDHQATKPHKAAVLANALRRARQADLPIVVGLQATLDKEVRQVANAVKAVHWLCERGMGIAK